jgi:hypothetical protein
MFAFGGISSVCGALVTMPLDTIKVRLQIQEKKIYLNTLDAFLKISKNEGFKALYNGSSPACIRQLTYGFHKILLIFKGTCKFGIYGILRKAMNVTSEETSLLTRFLLGFGSGGLSSGIFTPTDLVKTRMQAIDKSGRNYTGFFDAMRKIKNTEGYTALYHGWKPTSIQIHSHKKV